MSSFFDLPKKKAPRLVRVSSLPSFRWVSNYYLIADNGIIYSQLNAINLARGASRKDYVHKRDLMHRLQQVKDFGGYLCVALAAVKGGQRTVKVHRLVAEAFCGGLKDGLLVDHIDGDRTNNIAANLRVVDAKCNAVNNFKHFINDAGLSRAKGIRIVLVKDDKAQLFNSVGKTAKHLDYDNATVSKTAQHNTNLANGDSHKNRSNMGYRTCLSWRPYRYDDLNETIKKQIDELL